MDQFKQRPDSKTVPENTWRKQYRDEKPYPDIDKGRTRAERNAEIINLNLERAARSKDFKTSIAAQVERELGKREWEMKRRHTAIQRRLSGQEANIRGMHHAIIQKQLNERQGALNAAKEQTDWKLKTQLREMEHTHTIAMAHLREQHMSLKARLKRTVDVTGKTRRRQDDEKRQLAEMQEKERQAKIREAAKARAVEKKTIMEEHGQKLQQQRADRAAHLADMSARHAQDRAQIARELQQHEREREQARAMAQHKIQQYQKAQQEKAAAAKVREQKQGNAQDGMAERRKYAAMVKAANERQQQERQRQAETQKTQNPIKAEPVQNAFNSQSNTPKAEPQKREEPKIETPPIQQQQNRPRRRR